MKSNDDKNLKFEEALHRLEEIVNQLEDGVDELDKIVSLFEEGTQMVEYCQKKLIQVETKIEILSLKLSHEPKNEETE
jgi:exodeoxyribonuclease VII small subunit